MEAVSIYLNRNVKLEEINNLPQYFHVLTGLANGRIETDVFNNIRFARPLQRAISNMLMPK